jgi:transposase-like protein
MSIKCKLCLGSKIVKNGFVRDSQRFKCRSCGKNFIEGDKRKNDSYSKETRNMVIRMYLNNCGIRRIAHILRLPLSTTFGWIRKAGRIVDEMVKNRNEEFEKIDILEMDELFTYVKKSQEQIKKQGKESANISEYGLLWIGTDLKLFHLG